MENCETSVRQYNKSELPRLRWTPQLHQHFVEAIQSLGGKHKATPKRILQQMRVRGLRIAHIKSHLQMYRNRKGNANDLEVFSIAPTQRIILKGELHLLDNKNGLSSSEETDYDLNQEPHSRAWLLSDDMSNEEESFLNPSFSFSTPLISMMPRENSKDVIHFSSPTAAANHSIDSTSTHSFENNYINLDLTI